MGQMGNNKDTAQGGPVPADRPPEAEFRFDQSRRPRRLPCHKPTLERVTITLSRIGITTSCYVVWDGRYHADDTRVITMLQKNLVTDNMDGTFTMTRALAREKGFA